MQWEEICRSDLIQRLQLIYGHLLFISISLWEAARSRQKYLEESVAKQKKYA